MTELTGINGCRIHTRMIRNLVNTKRVELMGLVGMVEGYIVEYIV